VTAISRPRVQHHQRLRVELAKFSKAFARRSTGWMCRSTFESPRQVEAAGTQWLMWLSVHFVENDDDADRRLMSSVFFETERLSSTADRRLEQSGWYDFVAERLKRLGYEGSWQIQGKHPCGDFWKYGLGTAANAEREVDALDRFSLRGFVAKTPRGSSA